MKSCVAAGLSSARIGYSCGPRTLPRQPKGFHHATFPSRHGARGRRYRRRVRCDAAGTEDRRRQDVLRAGRGRRASGSGIRSFRSRAGEGQGRLLRRRPAQANADRPIPVLPEAAGIADHAPGRGGCRREEGRRSIPCESGCRTWRKEDSVGPGVYGHQGRRRRVAESHGQRQGTITARCPTAKCSTARWSARNRRAFRSTA